MAIELDDLKMTFELWIYLKDHHAIDVVLGCIVANTLIEGDPINLYLVAPPSSGKTEILRAVSEHPKVFSLSNLTPTTFVSGHKSRDGKNRSLLLKLKDSGKEIIILKDFTTVLELRRESRQEILSQIREISDGYYCKAFGTGEEINWSGRLAIIAGVTPVIDRHHSISQILGERFITYRMRSDDTRRMADMAQKVAGKERQMRRELGEMTKQFLEQFKSLKLSDIPISPEINTKLLSLSCFVAEARTAVSRDQFTREIEFVPEYEGPARLIKQLLGLGCGISVVQGKSEVDEEIYEVLKKIGLDCLPSHRKLILNSMWEKAIHGDHWEKTRTIAGYLNYPVATAKLQLEDLMILRLLDRKNEDYHVGETAPYLWKLSDHCCSLLLETELFGLEDRNAQDEEFDTECSGVARYDA
jgi:hypothetical protein